MRKKRNVLLNILEGVASICVVMLHCSFPGDIGRVIYGISRFAVPLFFAVSGYYIYNEDGAKVRNALPNKVKHITAIFLGTEVFYFIWHILQPFLIYGSFSGTIEWLNTKFTIKNIISFIIFQNTLIGDVSWFLVALIMCYLVTFPIAKHNKWKKCTLLILPLLCINVLLGEIGSLTGIKIQWYWCSNFWLLGFPCYALGFYLRIHEKKFMKLLTCKRIFWIVLGTGGLAVIERAVTGENQLYFSNIPFMVCSFMFCLKYPEVTVTSHILKSLSNIGEKYSLGVYILHPVIRDLLKIFVGKAGFNDNSIWNWCLPVLTVLFSIIIWWGWRIILTFLKRIKRESYQ